MKKRNARLFLMCMLMPLLGLTMVGWTWGGDYDGDGIPNKLEMRIGTNPALADTDGDSYTDYEEIVEYGFNPNVNPYEFNPWLADVPMLGVTATSPPEPYLEYTISETEKRTFETIRSDETATIETNTNTLGGSIGYELSISATAGVQSGVSETSKFSFEINYSHSWAHAEENRRTVTNAEAYEQATEVQERSGGLLLTAEIENRGHLAFRIENLILTAVTQDYDEPTFFRPIGNLTLDTSEDYVGFPEITIGPGEKIGPLNFCNRDLDLQTAKRLLWDSSGIIVEAPYFELLNANGVPFAFNLTEIRARTATVVIDYAGERPLEQYMVATNTHPHPSKNTVTLDKVLNKYLRLPHDEGTIDWPDPLIPGSLKAATGIYSIRDVEAFYDPADPNKKGWWTVFRNRSNGVEWETDVYDMAEGDYSASEIVLEAGDQLYMVYLKDGDGDTLYSREEFMLGTIDEEETPEGDSGLDSDGDGLSDYVEVRELGTDPRLPDTDGDGLGDFYDYDPLNPDWYSIAAGSNHSALIRTDGSLWMWGRNHRGQLGLGDTADHGRPFRVGLFENDWAIVDPSNQVRNGTLLDEPHTLAIKNDGTLWAWGDNTEYQCGTNLWPYLQIPVQIGSDSDWVDVAAGHYHNLALKANNTLWAWGRNYEGQLGNDESAVDPEHIPVQVKCREDSGVDVCDPGWIDISAGYLHSFGVRSDGTLRGWGDNSFHVLGLLSTSGKISATQVTDDTDWAQVEAGMLSTMGLKLDSTLMAWGHNHYGILGLGSNTEQYTPVAVNTGWKQISSGGWHTAGIRYDGSLYTWGSNEYGQLGLEATISFGLEQRGSLVTSTNCVTVSGEYAYVGNPDGLTVVDVSDPANPFRAGGAPTLFTGTGEGVAVEGSYAYLAHGTEGLHVFDISDPENPFVAGSIATSDAHGVAVQGDYAYVADWGGGLKVIDISDPGAPAQVGSVGVPGAGARDVAVKGDYAYVADYGYGLVLIDISDPAAPAQVGLVPSSSGHARGVALAGGFAFVADFEAGLRIIDVSDPTDPFFYRQVDLIGNAWDVVLKDSYVLVAMGIDGLAVIDANYLDVLDPQFATGNDMIDLAASGDFAYIADSSYALLVIDLMAGTTAPTLEEYWTPQRVGYDNDWAQVAVGYQHTLAVKTDGTVWAWGRNNLGQLGNNLYGDDYNEWAPICVTSVIPGCGCP